MITNNDFYFYCFINLILPTIGNSLVSPLHALTIPIIEITNVTILPSHPTIQPKIGITLII